MGHRHHGSAEVAPCYRGSKKFRDSAYIVTPAGSAGIGGAVPQVKRHSERQRECRDYSPRSADLEATINNRL